MAKWVLNITSSSCAALGFYMITMEYDGLFNDWFYSPFFVICCLCIPYLQRSPMVTSTELVCLSLTKFCTDNLRSWKEHFARKEVEGGLQENHASSEKYFLKSDKLDTKVDIALFINHWNSLTAKVSDVSTNTDTTK